MKIYFNSAHVSFLPFFLIYTFLLINNLLLCHLHCDNSMNGTQRKMNKATPSMSFWKMLRFYAVPSHLPICQISLTCNSFFFECCNVVLRCIISSPSSIHLALSRVIACDRWMDSPLDKWTDKPKSSKGDKNKKKQRQTPHFNSLISLIFLFHVCSYVTLHTYMPVLSSIMSAVPNGSRKRVYSVMPGCLLCLRELECWQ